MNKLTRPPKKKHKQTGADLIAVLQACPYPEIFDEIDRIRDEGRKFIDQMNELLAKDDEEKRSRAQRPSEVCP